MKRALISISPSLKGKQNLILSSAEVHTLLMSLKFLKFSPPKKTFQKNVPVTINDDTG